jgi:hypothetical protein
VQILATIHAGNCITCGAARTEPVWQGCPEPELYLCAECTVSELIPLAAARESIPMLTEAAFPLVLVAGKPHTISCFRDAAEEAVSDPAGLQQDTFPVSLVPHLPRPGECLHPVPPDESMPAAVPDDPYTRALPELHHSNARELLREMRNLVGVDAVRKVIDDNLASACAPEDALTGGGDAAKRAAKAAKAVAARQKAVVTLLAMAKHWETVRCELATVSPLASGVCAMIERKEIKIPCFRSACQAMTRYLTHKSAGSAEPDAGLPTEFVDDIASLAALDTELGRVNASASMCTETGRVTAALALFTTAPPAAKRSKRGAASS